jgi:rubrerythrin
MPDPIRYLVQEVHNFGGFFGGDTVTLTATRHERPSDEATLTIDQQALTNVRDRHTIATGMLLALWMAGDRVDRAELLGAASHAELRAALGIPALPPELNAPLVLSYCCPSCGLWVAGTPQAGACAICGAPIG